MYCTVVATPCDQYLNFIPDHMKITNRKAECRLKIYTEMCLWKDAFIAIETYKFDYSLFSFKATISNILKFGMTDNLMSINILIWYSFGDELGGNESTYITLKPYDFSWKNGRFQSIS